MKREVEFCTVRLCYCRESGGLHNLTMLPSWAVQDWAEDKADEAKHRSDNLASKAKHAAGDAGEWVEDRAHDAKEVGRDAAKSVEGTAKDAKRVVGHAADDAADALR